MSIIKTSVIYATARYGGIDILERCMKDQTVKNFEVVVVDELKRHDLIKDVLLKSGIPHKSIEPPPKKPDAYWNLSSSLNEGVRNASGETIILLQDYIWVPSNGIELFINHLRNEPFSIVTGTGHQYAVPDSVEKPEGLYSVWVDFPGIPHGEITHFDPRFQHEHGTVLTNPVEWEANWAAFPKKAWLDVGGFDEDFDYAGRGYDNVNFAERCQMAGYNIFLQRHNTILGYDHINLFDEREKNETAPTAQKMWHDKMRGMRKLHESWKLNYV